MSIASVDRVVVTKAGNIVVSVAAKDGVGIVGRKWLPAHGARRADNVASPGAEDGVADVTFGRHIDDDRDAVRHTVFKGNQANGIAADNDIKVAVTVEIGKRRSRSETDIDIERRARRQGGRRDRSGILEIEQLAQAITDDKVNVSVPVEIAKADRGFKPQIDAVERIGSPGSRDKVGAVAVPVFSK